MNPIAKQLNEIIENGSPDLIQTLSQLGRQLFFPKGILSQSAEAKEKAYRMNATIGIATEGGRTMCLDSVVSSIADIPPEESLTYAPSFGIPALRKAWRDALFEKNPSLAGKEISLPVVTNGITHALSMFGDLWLDPGDQLVLPAMMWGNYNLIFGVRRGVRIAHYTLFSPAGGLDLDAFAKTVLEVSRTDGKVAVVLNFPHNPSGYSPTVAEADRIVDILTEAAEGGARVIAATDDAYFGLFYDEETLQESIFARLCGRHPRLLAVKLDGATKENYVWGLRLGFITYGAVCAGDAAAVYEALEKKTAGCIRGNISNASHLGQSIVLRSLQNQQSPKQIREKYEILHRRALKVQEVALEAKYRDAWEVYPFNSGYFMCIRLRSGIDAEALRVHLLDRYGVGLISIDGANLRIAFSCLEEEQIPELFDTVLRAVEDLTKAT
ncbi:MAG: aminotransferase class I/II-fold pyridoxal phosphate-dependent enzyme [Desulfobacteraceae bacterium]|nr:aminotransferase class I/II-fold pyridoxal phosphate-dependent enzyme [Desulfobacteraceae bacterium]